MKTKIYGHRGSMGNFPENTLLSIKKAIEQGAGGIEIDVHLTKDGEVAVIHDESLDATTSGSGLVKDHTLPEIKKLNAGIKFFPTEKHTGPDLQVPALAEVLKLLNDTDGGTNSHTNIELNIELKTYLINYENIEEKVLSLVDRFGAGRKIVYSSFHLPSILRVKKLDSTANIAWLLGDKVSLPHPTDYMDTLGLEALHLNKSLILSDPDHYMGLYDKLRIWTVNDKKDIETLIKLGVGAIITDYPDRASALLPKKSATR